MILKNQRNILKIPKWRGREKKGRKIERKGRERKRGRNKKEGKLKGKEK